MKISAVYNPAPGKDLPGMRFFVWILLAMLSLPVAGQKYFFDSYGVEQGLGSSKIYCILQDHRDLVWLGTEAGVSRFDGHTFVDFSSEQGMAENGVYSVFEDSRGNIWFGHLDGGITRYDGYHFEVIRFDSLSVKGDITSILETQDHHLWITTSASGALRITHPFGPVNEMEVEQFLGKKGLSDRIFGSFLSRDDDYYCLSDVGIHKYVPAVDSFTIFTLKHFTHYWSKTCMLEDRKGNMWFGTYNGGLYKYDKAKDTMIVYDKRDGLAKNWVSCLYEDSRGDLWVGTFGGGITRIRDGQLKTYNTGNGLNDDVIQCLTEDHEGNLLIGTRYHGLSIFKGEQFLSISVSDGLSSPSVWSICQAPGGAYWFGTNSGITVYDPGKAPEKKFRYYNRKEDGIEDQIRTIVRDPSGNLWIGTYQGGIFQYNLKKQRFFYDFYLNRNLYRDLIVTALAVDKHGNIWAGTHDGLAWYDPHTRAGTRYTQGKGLMGNGITALCYDPVKNNLWIGSERKKGLTCYHLDTKKFEKIPLTRQFAPLAITLDGKGNLWMGSAIGLFAWNNDSLYLHLTEEDGLLSNHVNLVMSDEKGNIYIGTNKGLNKYVPDEKKMFIYTKHNGFTGIETLRNAVYHDRQGYFWFGTANGVTRLDPRCEPEKVMEPLTHIRSMQVNYEPRRMTGGLKLNYRENAIMFNYYSICLTNPDAVRYRVMLEGADAGWRPVTTQTRAIYSALPPGKYTFKVIARNSQGVWNSTPVSFSFLIRPPFYRTWWFILIILILVTTGIMAYIKIREQNLIREKLILERKVAERTAEVLEKSKELEKKNKDITDSIRYAKRIQNAILPPADLFPDTFVYFRPKDIVSGDFFWMNTLGTKRFIAAVDCTGHGVPGAFMSFIGYNSLNKIVNERNITEAAAILDQLNEEVYKTLHVQSKDRDVKDGMDLALLVYDTETRTLQYAGSNNPLYLIRQGELLEIKADRFSIGMLSVDTGRKFTNHVLEMKEGDMTYIFSDGYADQFGGPEGKKFKSRQLKQLFLKIHDLSGNEQKRALEETLVAWMGREEQIDDILIIGTRY